MEYQDITKTGPVGLKGLKGLNRIPEMGEFENVFVEFYFVRRACRIECL